MVSPGAPKRPPRLPLEEAWRTGRDALVLGTLNVLDLEADNAELTAEPIVGCSDEMTEFTMLFWPEEKLDLAGVKLCLTGVKLGLAGVKLGLTRLVEALRLAPLLWL